VLGMRKAECTVLAEVSNLVAAASVVPVSRTFFWLATYVWQRYLVVKVSPLPGVPERKWRPAVAGSARMCIWLVARRSAQRWRMCGTLQ